MMDANDLITAEIDFALTDWLTATLATDRTDANLHNLITGALAGIVRFVHVHRNEATTVEALEGVFAQAARDFWRQAEADARGTIQ